MIPYIIKKVHYSYILILFLICVNIVTELIDTDYHYHIREEISMLTTSLAKLHSGEICKIQKINAGMNATKRLYEMGLNTGSRVKVVKNDIGPVIVSLYGNKIAVGRGLAEKIIVAD